MTEIKVGDTVVSVFDEDIDIKIGNKYVVTYVDDYTIEFNDDVGYPRKRSPRYYRVISSATPPQKITQNGYEYSLVGPVKPEWLVDGAWVVSRITGTLYKTKQVGNDRFQAIKGDGFNNSGNLTAEEFSDAYRPHEPKDWKWGDWAMYDGKRVFVIGCVEDTGMIGVSLLNIDKDGSDSFDKNYGFIHPSELTPTF